MVRNYPAKKTKKNYGSELKKKKNTKGVQKRDHFKTTKPTFSPKEQTSYTFLLYVPGDQHIFLKVKFLWNAETFLFCLVQGESEGQSLGWTGAFLGTGGFLQSETWEEYWTLILPLQKCSMFYQCVFLKHVSIFAEALKCSWTILFPLSDADSRLVWASCLKSQVCEQLWVSVENRWLNYVDGGGEVQNRASHSI